MTTYFAFRLADATQQGLDELLANLDAGTSAPQHELHTRVQLELVDEILRNSVEGLIAQFQAGAEGAGVLTTLLNLLKGTAHMLVRQLLGKGSNEDVARMAQFLRQRRVTPGGQVLFGFELPPELAGRFRAVFGAIARGEGEAHRADLQKLMIDFADQAMVHFYDDFVAPMHLGFIKRKTSDLARATINKGNHAAMNRLIPQLQQPEMKVMADYFGSLLVDA